MKSSVNSGMSMVEIVVVVAIIGIVLVSISQLMVLSTGPIRASARQTDAVFLAEEALEAVRVLRTDSWTNNIESTANGATYYPVISGSNWTLSASDPGPINGLYTRTVVMDAVYRDVNDDITQTTGTLDSDTRKITATISWSEKGQSKNVVLETYLTNFLNN